MSNNQGQVCENCGNPERRHVGEHKWCEAEWFIDGGRWKPKPAPDPKVEQCNLIAVPNHDCKSSYDVCEPERDLEQDWKQHCINLNEALTKAEKERDVQIETNKILEQGLNGAESWSQRAEAERDAAVADLEHVRSDSDKAYQKLWAERNQLQRDLDAALHELAVALRATY